MKQRRIADAISDMRSAEELELLTQTTMAVQSEIGTSSSGVLQSTIAGSMRIFSTRNAQRHAGSSPDDRSGVLEPSLIQTDEYGLSNIDGLLMG